MSTYKTVPKNPKIGDELIKNFWSYKTFEHGSYGENDDWSKTYFRPIKIGIMIIGIIFAITSLFGSFFINTVYEKSVVTFLGKLDRVEGEGFHFKIPLFEDFHTADLRIEKLVLDSMVAMKGGANVIEIQLTVNHQINPNDNNIKRLYSNYGSRYDYEDRLLTNISKDRIKSIIGKYSIEGFLENREKIRINTKSIITNEMSKYGIVIKDIQLSDIKFSDDYTDRLKDVAKARARAAQAEQQAREADFIANAKEAQARGEANALKLHADANAYQIKVESTQGAEKIRRIGRANADAINQQNKAASGSDGLSKLRKAEAMNNWNGSVPQFMTGNTGSGSIFPFLNMNKLMQEK
jgi:regulator of protease activity HflC (stomatin/prohibitin superfamily)